MKKSIAIILTLTLALAVIVSPALLDQIPTYDLMPSLVAGFEGLIEFLK